MIWPVHHRRRGRRGIYVLLWKHGGKVRDQGRLHLLIDTRPWRNIKFEASNCEASHFCEASQAYSHSHRHICKASHWYSHSNCIKGYSIRIRLVPIKYTSPHFSQNWHRGVFCSIAQPGEVPRLPTVGPSSRGPTIPRPYRSWVRPELWRPQRGPLLSIAQLRLKENWNCGCFYTSYSYSYFVETCLFQ